MTLIWLLVALVVIGLIFWAVRALSAAFGIPPPVTTVIYVLLVVIVVLWLLSSFGVLGSMGFASRPLVAR